MIEFLMDTSVVVIVVSIAVTFAALAVVGVKVLILGQEP